MAEVKWIKLSTEIFDNRKIRQIECLPDGDAIIVIWMKLMCLAGNINDSGYVYFTKEIPYTDHMLATQFNRNLTTVQLALRTFQQFGMIEIIDNVLHISNWEKYQNVDGMAKIREQTRARVARHRENQRLLQSENDVTLPVTLRNATEEDKKEDKKREEEDKKKEIDYQHIADLYNETCVSFPAVKKLSDTRKKAIKARINSGYTVDDFATMFQMAESSSFLKGKNDRNWAANFDWMIKDSNFVKILDGNYADKGRKEVRQAKPVDNSISDFERMINGICESEAEKRKQGEK